MTFETRDMFVSPDLASLRSGRAVHQDRLGSNAEEHGNRRNWLFGVSPGQAPQLRLVSTGPGRIQRNVAANPWGSGDGC